MNSDVAIASLDRYELRAVKDAVQGCLVSLGMGGTLTDVVHPGDKVFIKPNWVASRWRQSCPHTDTIYSVITHPSVVEAVADLTAEALQGKGEIIIGDNPSIDADFDELMALTRMKRLEGKYDVKTSVMDLRPLVCEDLKYYGQKDKMAHRAGDINGVVEADLGEKSMLRDVDPGLFHGVFDDRADTVKWHSGGHHVYTFSKSIWDADVYISVPKLKTHQKVGATLNLKGLVGSVAVKDQLVHWRVGSPESQGDEYPSIEALEAAKKSRVTHRGAWPGNDTIWRMVCDLYSAMMTRPRRYFSVVDGITAGEGGGPFCPTAKNANTLIAGQDLLAVDLTAARWMGLDPGKIKYLSHFAKCPPDVKVWVDGKVRGDFFTANTRYKDFAVLPQWECVKFGNGGES